MARPRAVIDIETAGLDLDRMDEATRRLIFKDASTEEEVQETLEAMPLHPATGQIIAIGIMDPDTLKGHMLYQDPAREAAPTFEEEGVVYEHGSEAHILSRFWQHIQNYGAVVTFNGRSFDCPYLILRSAVHNVRPSRDLMPGRYQNTHIDLMERLTFYGSSRKRVGLDLWCRTLGIQSPKEGFSGKDVPEMFKQGRAMEIARYCARDLVATSQLLKKLEPYLNIEK